MPFIVERGLLLGPSLRSAMWFSSGESTMREPLDQIILVEKDEWIPAMIRGHVWSPWNMRLCISISSSMCGLHIVSSISSDTSGGRDVPCCKRSKASHIFAIFIQSPSKNATRNQVSQPLHKDQVSVSILQGFSSCQKWTCRHSSSCQPSRQLESLQTKVVLECMDEPSHDLLLIHSWIILRHIFQHRKQLSPFIIIPQKIIKSTNLFHGSSEGSVA